MGISTTPKAEQPPPASLPERDWAVPTTLEVLNIDSNELAETLSATEDEGQEQMPPCVLLDHRHAPVRQLGRDSSQCREENNGNIANFARLYGFDMAYAISLTLNAATPTSTGPRLKIIRKVAVASYGLAQDPRHIIETDVFCLHVVKHGMFRYFDERPEPGEPSYYYAVSICATCFLCCGQGVRSHIHRVVLVGLRLAGDGLSEDQQDDLYIDAWRMVRRDLQYPQDSWTHVQQQV